MNQELVDKLTDLFELQAISVLVHGDAIIEIREAARRQKLTIRFISPSEFSVNALHEDQWKNLLVDRNGPVSIGFWTGLRQALHISESVQVLVFQGIDQLDSPHDAALESVVKGDMDSSDQGARFEHVLATSVSTAPFSPRLERSFQHHLYSAPKWVTALESKAAHVLTGKLSGWPSGDYACPWLRWYSRTTNDRPEVVFILQDWGVEGESLDEAIDLLEKGEGDPTIRAVTQTMRLNIKSHTVCVMNAVWGLRKVHSKKTGYLGHEIHRATFPIWAEALQTLDPKVTCLCGEWAKWQDLDWETPECGSTQIGRWNDWLKESGSISPVDSEKFRNQTFYSIPHPSAWRFNFSAFVEKLNL